MGMKLIIRLLAIFVLAFFGATYFLIDKALTENIDSIEQVLNEQTGLRTKIKGLDLSILNVKVEHIEISGGFYHAEINNLQITPTHYWTLFVNYLNNDLTLNPQFIKSLKAKDINIFYLTSEAEKELNKELEQAPNEDIVKTIDKFISYISPIQLIQVDKLKINDVIVYNSKFNLKEDKFFIQSSINYKKEKIDINGNINLSDFLSTRKLNADLVANVKELDLSKINPFLESSDIKIKNGKITGSGRLIVENNNWKILLNNTINNYTIDAFGKDLIFNPLKVTTIVQRDLISLSFNEQPIVNNTKLDIEKIDIHPDETFTDLKKIKIYSKNLSYDGLFSDKFLLSEGDKSLLIKFNIADVNYFNLLGIFDIPTPISQSILKDGELTVKFLKKNKKYDIKYSGRAKAFLDVEQHHIKSNFSIIDNKLLFDDFYLNDESKKIKIEYYLKNDDFYVNAESYIDEPIYKSLKNVFNLSPDIKFNKKAFLIVNLNRIKNKYSYSGTVKYFNNNVIFNYDNTSYQFNNISGQMGFNTHKIVDSNLVMDEFKKGEFVLKKVKLSTNKNKEKFNIFINSNLMDGVISYLDKEDHLKINLTKLDYQIQKEEAVKILTENKQHIERVQNLDLPKKINLHIDDFTFFNYHLGSVDIASDKNPLGYNITTKNKNNASESTIYSLLDLKYNITNNIKLYISDPEKFNDIFGFKKIIKNATITLEGKLNTNISQRDYSHVVSNLNGTLRLKSEDGEFTENNNGIGYLLSIFNFRTIPDIISLDFKNIFSNKLNYDKINSELVIKNGIIQLNDSHITSKISESKMSGQINLNNSKINIELKIVPKLTNSIIFTAVNIAKGFNPAILIGSTLIEKIVPMPNIIYYTYKINGTIEDPQIEK